MRRRAIAVVDRTVASRCCSPAARSAPTTGGRTSRRRRRICIEPTTSPRPRTRMVEAVRRPGARSADRRCARQQQERHDRRGQRRAGRRRVHQRALAAVSADRLPGRRRAAAPAGPARSRRLGMQNPDQLVPGVRRPRAGRSTCGAASAARPKSAQANLLATEEARRGVILSLVASVATTYLQLRGFDEQLVIAQRTRDATPNRCGCSSCKFKYGVVSEMNVEQARAQYETAAAQNCRRSSSEIAVTENALSILLGRNPGPIPRGKPIADVIAAGDPGRTSVAAARAPSGHRCRPSRT